MIPLRDTIPTRRTPVVTIALIVVNLAVFLYSQAAPSQIVHTTAGQAVRISGFDAITFEYGFVPCELRSECPHGDDTIAAGNVDIVVEHVAAPLTVLTAMFLHGGWSHVLGNMLFLWIFGNNIEDRLGRPRFIVFYLLGGLAAAALQFAVSPTSDVPNIGASGAIAAVLGAYAVLHPLSPVLTYVPPFFFLPIPAVFFLGVWFALQLLLGSQAQVGPATQGGVAYFAHVGGFLFGMLTIKLWGSTGPPRSARYA
jgi:membrane associated rhomboid family serine protease